MDAEHLIDRLVRNISHGRFERSLSGLTAPSALVTAQRLARHGWRVAAPQRR